MWILEEGQILPYLRSHYPVFDQSGPVDIQCIGALEERRSLGNRMKAG